MGAWLGVRTGTAGPAFEKAPGKPVDTDHSVPQASIRMGLGQSTRRPCGKIWQYTRQRAHVKSEERTEQDAGAGTIVL
ncbi:hypothetical protein GCM10010341_46840 [Streptomyces noursei]|nr:hypothetical protein GCM10010341_46840 [Streptomyces noursei]